jgi:mannose-6-phosphate isomerase-like protein (cupin superfamily)
LRGKVACFDSLVHTFLDEVSYAQSEDRSFFPDIEHVRPRRRVTILEEAAQQNIPIIANSSRQVFTLPGLKHQTLASGADQLSHLEVWMQRLKPGATTPEHYHECEEVIVVLKGAGRLSVGGETSDFGPGTTLVCPPRSVHQLINSGTEEMLLIAGL